MEKSRSIKVMSIIALVVAIVGMSLGFAAFSTTLNISSSAMVTPNEDDFSIEILGQDENEEFFSLNSSFGFADNGAVASSAKITNGKTPYIGDINIGFSEPGQTVTYSFMIKNTGKYMTYLKSGKIKLLDGMGDVIECSTSESSNVSKELMDAACDAIDIRLILIREPENPDSYFGNVSLRDVFSIVGTDPSSFGSSFFIEPSGEMAMSLVVIYNSNGARADGDFEVKLASCELEFSTTSGN